MLQWRSAGEFKILDFDIETRKQGFHYGGKGKPDGCEPIAIACSWVGSPRVKSIVLSEPNRIPEMLEWFLEFYDQADMVTGHYIRKFDLPILNGATLEWGMSPLSEKLVCDTKCDLISLEGLSKSQENLSMYLQLQRSKFHMADADWRRAGRLTQGGQQRSRKRVEGDVRQHKDLRVGLASRGFLRDPRLWPP